VLAETRPDILLLTHFDWDHDGRALDAFAARLAEAGLDYPHRFANSGKPRHAGELRRRDMSATTLSRTRYDEAGAAVGTGLAVGGAALAAGGATVLGAKGRRRRCLARLVRPWRRFGRGGSTTPGTLGGPAAG
ncbi:hypothetical protein VB636_01215, partial [Paracoccus sp. APAP_BH8]